MKTSFYEADQFTGAKGKHCLTINSDYRWEKGDEVWVEESTGKRSKLRITWVVVNVTADGVVERELLGLRI
jgi:hypothetical protein